MSRKGKKSANKTAAAAREEQPPSRASRRRLITVLAWLIPVAVAGVAILYAYKSYSVSYAAQQPVFQIRQDFSQNASAVDLTVQNLGAPALESWIEIDVLAFVAVGKSVDAPQVTVVRLVNFYEVPPPPGPTRYSPAGDIFKTTRVIEDNNEVAGRLLEDLEATLKQTYQYVKVSSEQFVTVHYRNLGDELHEKSYVTYADVFSSPVNSSKLAELRQLADENETWIVLGRDSASDALAMVQRASGQQLNRGYAVVTSIFGKN